SYLPFRHLHSFPTRRSSDLISLIRSGGQFQMVIGNDVSNLYDAINETYQVQVDDSEESDHSNQTVLDRFIDLLSNLFQPFLGARSEEHTSELQSRFDIVCRL